MPTSIQQIVSDPDFGKLSAEDQSAVVAHFDSSFNSVPDSEKAAVIGHLQRQAISRPDLASPPGVPRPQVNMQQMDLSGGPVRNAPTAGLPGSSPNPVAATPGYTAAVGLPLAAAAAVAAPTVAPGAVAAAKWAAKRGVMSAAINQARKIPVVGPYIPSGMEWAPFFYGGGGAAGAAKAAGGAAAAGEAETLASKLAKPPEPAPAELEIRGTSGTAADPVAQSAGRITVPAAVGGPANPELAEPARTTAGAGPRVLDPESVSRGILQGFDNKTLVQIARSRGIDITAEKQLKATVGNGRIITKILDDMKPEELKELQDRWIESTRMGLPQGIGPQAYRTAAVQTYFPELKTSKAALSRMQKALANRGAQ